MIGRSRDEAGAFRRGASMLALLLAAVLCACGGSDPPTTRSPSPWHRLATVGEHVGGRPQMVFEDSRHGWLAAESGTGVFESRDGARSWRPSSARVVGVPRRGAGALPERLGRLPNVHQLLMADSSLLVVYEGRLLNGRQDPGLRAGVLVSRDGGLTFRRCLVLAEADASILAVTASDERHIWALCGRGDELESSERRFLLASDDAGKSWHRVWQGDGDDSGVKPFLATPIQFTDARTGWDSGSLGVLKTTDGGATWGSVGSPGKTFSMALDGDHLWAAWGDWGESEPTTGGLSRSSDGGNTWRDVGQFDGMVLFGQELYFADDSCGWLVAPGSQDRLAIWATRDGGTTWDSEFEWRPFGRDFTFARAGDALICSNGADTFIRTLASASR